MTRVRISVGAFLHLGTFGIYFFNMYLIEYQLIDITSRTIAHIEPIKESMNNTFRLRCSDIPRNDKNIINTYNGWFNFIGIFIGNLNAILIK